MSLFPTLLRLLLCLTLVANGVGFAQASTHLHPAHAAPGPAAPGGVHASAVGSDCPPGVSLARNEAVAVPHHPAMHRLATDDSVSAQPAPPSVADAADCCASSGCQCPCPQHCSATVFAALRIGLSPAPSAVAVYGTAQHAPPRLPHSIRPPIR